jgi:spore coat protein A
MAPVIQMFNTAPDAPFGGFPNIASDPTTTGQVMRFVVNTALLGASSTDEIRALDGTLTNATTAATPPDSLGLSPVEGVNTYPVGVANLNPAPRDQALIEEESQKICATVAPTGAIVYDPTATPDPANPGTCVVTGTATLAASVPFAPKAAVLGVNGSSPAPKVTLWSDPLETNIKQGDTETWEFWNWTVDGHPIHVHEVKFKVLSREAFDPLTGALSGVVRPAEFTEAGWKDTVIAYPGQVTRIAATFDLAGLYVWHCHIVEHEDNEMMVPYCIGDPKAAPGCSVVPNTVQ